jgi:pyruvate/2-oxoglutarate dehydrogenase complex dihydrolipoamide dehydrogenase (E3) component
VLLVDRGLVEPGDGPQRASLVSALAASAAGAAAMRSAPRLGLVAVDPKINMKTVEDRARQVAAAMAPLDSPERLAALGIDVISGQTQFVDATTLAVGTTQVRAQAYIIATGGSAIIPDIPGLEEAGYFTLDSLLENTRKLTHLLVIGGDPEGLALAQAYARLGSQVTLVPQGWAFEGFDIEAASMLAHALTADGVKILDGARMREIQPRSQGIGAVVDLADGSPDMLDLSHVLVCSGRAASLASLNPDAARLRVLRGRPGHFALGTMGQTSNRKVRIVGAGAGHAQWSHALAHGRAVVEAMVAGVPRRRPSAQPVLVQTDPPLAQVGHMPADPSKLVAGHALLRSNLSENDLLRARAEEGGLIKVLVGPKGQVLGASIVGPLAGELAGVLALAVDRGIGIDSLAELSLPNPSVLGSLVALAGNRQATRTVSSFARRRGELLRLLGL